MIHITLGPERPADPEVDELGRSRVGFSDDMDERELYEANHGCWVLGPRADLERHALMSFAGRVRQAIEIESIEPVPPTRPGRERRRVINGRILGPGDPVHDLYVGREAPVLGVRNPITYVGRHTAHPTCACGCGAEVRRGAFVAGHDQRAVHERIARVGTVVDFLRWFDATFEPAVLPSTPGTGAGAATGERGTGAAEPVLGGGSGAAGSVGVRSERIPGGGYALRNVVVAGSLDDLRGPLSGRFRLPLHLDASARSEHDLADPDDRRLVYRTVLLEAARESDHAEWLDRDTLLQEWPDLHLPQVVRSAWERAHPELRARPSAPDLVWH